MPRKLLIINPNSSSAITASIKSGIDHHTSPEILNTYWTCASAPLVLQSQDIERNADTCLSLLLGIIGEFDAFLLACYADHPLITLLQAQAGDKPVVGIFEASINAALSGLQPFKRFAILTTGQGYQKQLEEGVVRITGKPRANSCFAGVVSTGIGLHDLAESSSDTVKTKIKAGVKEILGKGNISTICMGGVILFGLEPLVKEACQEELGIEAGRDIIVIDQLEAGAAVARSAVLNISNVP